jgi:hypothetical protein
MMTMIRATLCLLLFVPLVQADIVHAQGVDLPLRIHPDVWRSSGFQAAHPDLKHRMLAIEHLDAEESAEALEEFKKAARWGDKLSQAMLAEMYWKGQGVRENRVEAYIWMDLAAERGFKPFLANRERYWSALTEGERNKVLQAGPARYDIYGDDFALPRLKHKLESDARKSGRSRTGFVGVGDVMVASGLGSGRAFDSLGIDPPNPTLKIAGGVRVNSAWFYAPEYWHIERYIEWQNQQIEVAYQGIVRVGEVADAEN